MKALLSALALFNLSCTAPYHPAAVREMGLMLRPDTRAVYRFTIDTPVVAAMSRIFNAALPNEIGLCLYGHIVKEDIPELYREEQNHGYHVFIDSVEKAIHINSTPFFIEYSSDPSERCPNNPSLLGIAHDHIYFNSSDGCSHSNADASVLVSDPRLLLSVVFCWNGFGSALWQDGRQYVGQWGKPLVSPQLPDSLVPNPHR